MKCFDFNMMHPIKIEFLNKGRLTPPRLHVHRRLNTYIAYIITEGILCLQNDHQVLRLQVGDICIFEPGELQLPTESTACAYYYVHFDCAGIMAAERTPEEFFRHVRQEREIFINADARGFERFEHFTASVMKVTHIADPALFLRLTATLEDSRVPLGNNSIQRRFHAAAVFTELLLEAENYTCNTILGSDHGSYKTYKAATQIRQYIDQNFQEDFTRDDIQQQFSFQYDYANRLFKKYTGQSIIRYRNSKRIEAARFLLATTDKEPERIAAECGFKDPYYFTKYFKKLNGCTPAQYRQKGHGNVLL